MKHIYDFEKSQGKFMGIFMKGAMKICKWIIGAFILSKALYVIS